MDEKMMKKISEILEPSEEQKERMLSNISDSYENKMEENKENISKKRFMPALTTAAMISLCCIVTTVLAAAHMGLDIDFLHFLKPSNEAQAEYLADGAYIVNKQVKNKNGTLDIKQVIGDSNVAFILMDFTASHETVLNKAHYDFEDINIDFGTGFADYEIVSLKDENRDDNKISMVLRIHTQKSLMGQKLHLELTNLTGSDTIPGEFTSVISGNWKTSFPLDFKNYSTDYQINQAIKMFDYSAEIKTISVSPISITVKLESSFAREINDAAGRWEELGDNKYSDLYPVTINYKDGTAETTSIFHGMHHFDYSTGKILFIKTFETVINEKEIASVTFFGKEIIINLSSEYGI